RESRPGENRVAGTPTTVPDLVALGHHVLVEVTAGARASFPDGAYAGAGVELVGPDEVWASDVVIKVRPPEPEEVARLRSGATVVSLLAPAQSPELLRSL